MMSDKDIIATIDNVANALLNLEIKGRDALRMSEVFKALSAIQEELKNRKDDE